MKDTDDVQKQFRRYQMELAGFILVIGAVLLTFVLLVFA